MTKTQQLLNSCNENGISLTEKVNELTILCESFEKDLERMNSLPESSQFLESAVTQQDDQIERLETKAEEWKDKYYEMRRHCRSANKGAERNSMVMRLLAEDNKALKEKIKLMKEIGQV